MKRSNLLALCLAALLLLASCSVGHDGATADMEASTAVGGIGANYDNGKYVEAPSDFPASTESQAQETGSSVYQNSDAKLIRRAELTIQTTEFDQAVAALDELVNTHGGYYENASVYAGSYRNAHANRSGEYVVRIPSASYEAFRFSTGDLGYVVRSTQSSENVGEQYYDAEARLKTQRTKQERLLKLLEQAATMEDIIDLESALSEVEYEIEQLSSTLNRYDALIDFSTFIIYLEEVAKVTEEVGETDSLGKRMSAGFADSLDSLVTGTQDLLVWLSYNIFGLVVLAVVVVVAVLVGRRAVKKAARRLKGPDQPAE